ncbi:tetratricopeptide repeat protein [Gorillibacterium sp. CAU 1737]|uniref:tetratricopeptide repeat protein n=1 Tax=Gorillibacterium sp. CAU 1737 TaxID=3140362 RepID=UPI0032603AA6
MSSMEYQRELLIINNYIEMERYSHALELLFKALEKTPSDAYLIYLAALCHYELDQGEEALDACKTALAGGYRPDECYFLLGQIQLQMDRFEAAEAALLAALDLDPQNAEFLAFYGYYHMLTGNNHRALELINQALVFDPENLNALHYKFYYYLGMDDSNGIRSKVVDAYFSKSNDETDRFLKAGMLDYYKYDYKSAEENLRQAFQLDPTNKYILKMLDRITRKPRFYYRWKRIIRRQLQVRLFGVRSAIKLKWVLFKGAGLTRETSVLFTVPLAFLLLLAAVLILIL